VMPACSAGVALDRTVDTAPARAAMLANAADRAVDDPAKLARAARIVRAALARRKLTLDDLTPPDGEAA
jgi:hypothetical protein